MSDSIKCEAFRVRSQFDQCAAIIQFRRLFQGGRRLARGSRREKWPTPGGRQEEEEEAWLLIIILLTIFHQQT